MGSSAGRMQRASTADRGQTPGAAPARAGAAPSSGQLRQVGLPDEVTKHVAHVVVGELAEDYRHRLAFLIGLDGRLEAELHAAAEDAGARRGIPTARPATLGASLRRLRRIALDA